MCPINNAYQPISSFIPNAMKANMNAKVVIVCNIQKGRLFFASMIIRIVAHMPLIAIIMKSMNCNPCIAFVHLYSP